MKKRGETFLPENFEPNVSTRKWCEGKYPMVDIQATTERFCDSAKAHGWCYRDWQAAFKTVIRKGMDNGWRSIVSLKGGKEFDPKWQAILHEGRKHGFREPHEFETPGTYKTAYEIWQREPRSQLPGLAALAGSLRARGN